MSRNIALSTFCLACIIAIYNLSFFFMNGNFILGAKRDDNNSPNSIELNLDEVLRQYDEKKNKKKSHYEHDNSGRWKIDEPIEDAHWSKGIIGSPDSTMISIDDCRCELVSIDCLETIKCCYKNNKTSYQLQQQQIYSGIVRRQAIKAMAEYEKEPFEILASWMPIGKSFQFLSQALFREWMKRSKLYQTLPNLADNTVNATSYKFCKEKKLQGKMCAINDFSEIEEFGIIEEEAMRLHNGVINKELRKEDEEKLWKFWRNRFDTTPYEYLLIFAHMTRIAFNIRSHIIDSYQAQIKTIAPSQGKSKEETLRVAMHIRRGDSCDHALSGYQKKASPLNSRAQVSGHRYCYETAVYMNALERVHSLSDNRHLEVYVSTDHLLDLMDEIKKDHFEIYRKITWKYVDHSRDTFNYSHTLVGGSKFIEYSQSHSALGATAFLDIWHLSHGQVFIGHLGSRFGKLSWWQATARYNSFIPFFSVDGHSMCCDIDEDCGRVLPSIISMENCLTFSRDYTNYVLNETEYWSIGSFVRFQLAKNEIDFRKKRDPNYHPPTRYNATY